ncbi:MAG: hypothetical protein CR960_00645, partial [Pasteurellales bacterium]
EIDLENAISQKFVLKEANLKDGYSSGDKLFIHGDDNDVVELKGNFTKVDTGVTQAGEQHEGYTYDVYTHSGVDDYTVYIETGLIL